MYNMFNEKIDYKPDDNEMTLRSMLWGHHGIVTGTISTVMTVN